MAMKSRPGVRPSDMHDATYQEHTRCQSNGGRSLKPDVKIRYSQALALVRYLRAVGW